MTGLRWAVVVGALLQALVGGTVMLTRSSDGVADRSDWRGGEAAAEPNDEHVVTPSSALGGDVPQNGERRDESVSGSSDGPEAFTSPPPAPGPTLPVRTRYVELTADERADLDEYRDRATSPGRAVSADTVAEGRVDDGSIWRLYGGPDPVRGICFSVSQLSRDRQSYGGAGDCSASEFAVQASHHGQEGVFKVYGFGDARGHSLVASTSDGRTAALPVALDSRLGRAFFMGHFDCGVPLTELRLLDRSGAVLASHDIDFSDSICPESEA